MIPQPFKVANAVKQSLPKKGISRFKVFHARTPFHARGTIPRSQNHRARQRAAAVAVRKMTSGTEVIEWI